ncbi:MAG: sulfatase-like hydrolase/transferase [Deltaproteobacteria bacterium]|nr:sulfatase-like hydrolase/transferase [Deltaproteobacteria bacterium]
MERRLPVTPVRMPAVPEPPDYAWIVIAHVVGATLIGLADSARLKSGGITAAVVPMFAVTGLAIGLVVAGCERLAEGRSRWMWAPLVALPTLAVTIPVCATLFDGAYAQTLPLAKQAPYLLPPVLWLLAAAALAIGRHVMKTGDLYSRSIGILVVGGVLGGTIWAERHVLGTGYRTAHIGATVMVIALAGLAVRILWRGRLHYTLACAVGGLAVGIAIAAAFGGLTNDQDRARLATFGDQSKWLVTLWRGIVDFDRDGSSPILGGGDCDDRDATRHPGALDTPGDGIDQDCDGADAVPVVIKKPAPVAPAASAPTRSLHAEHMNVLLITVDALRFDLLAPDAPDRADFPNLTKLLADSAWFTHAIAPASGTDVSLSTLLTGRMDPFQPVATTLLEAVRAQGRRVYAAVPGEVTRYVGDTLLNRGVDHFVTVQTDWNVADVGDHVSAPATSIELSRSLKDAAGRPWMVWLHFFDVHEHHQIDVPKYLMTETHDGASVTSHKYRALLRAIDDEVGKLLAQVDLQNTIVIFASDHGEALGEDPRLLDTHGQVTYAPLVRVPFAIRVPGVAGAIHTDTVSLVDIAPTLLDLLGAPQAMQTDGVDLVPALLGEPLPAGRAIVIHEELQWSVVEWPYQLILRPADNVVELYDLDQDPAEHHDLSAVHPEIVSRLRGRYAEAPVVKVDRTPSGRTFREQQAQPPSSRAPQAGSAATSTP